MFTHTEMVPLDDDLLFEIRADRFNLGHVVPFQFPCAVFLGAKWAQNRACWGAKWGMAGE
jgi:hypothetical protein